MDLGQITPIIITLNESQNLRRTLDRLKWARRTVIVDGGSSDDTLQICGMFRNSDVIFRKYDNFADQWNFALEQVLTDWTLSLDADYVLSEELIKEISELRPNEPEAGYSARFIYCVHGKALRSSLYPERTVLYRTRCARYKNFGHTQRVLISGAVGKLTCPIFHDDRKPIDRWLSSQIKYANEEATYLMETKRKSLRMTDKLRLGLWPTPVLVAVYLLFFKGVALDGRGGLYYVLQRVLAETIILLKILDKRLSRGSLGGEEP